MRDDVFRRVSRRDLLRASVGAVGVGGGLRSRSSDHDDDRSEGCSETTLGPDEVGYEDGDIGNCSDDHPTAVALKADVQRSLATRYPTVGALIDEGYVPYFDFLAADGADAWSHWINPAYVDDDGVIDPERPEAVLVDHRWWRPIGVMYVATRNGRRISPPPTVYGDDGEGGEDGGASEAGEGGEDGERCAPWHAHVGLPGRYAWWKFRQAYSDAGDEFVASLSCRTPWVMHVWAYPNPDGVHAHGAPPRGNRGGPPAERAGFETNAVPGETPLGWEVLPAAFRRRIAHL
ncbi:hypothetical protein BRC97_12635 [Halobacteriales archaeon QS_6_71_20]|nr:MAG: hypothetical protein BRC97_12635 [Halobacteriales archaeon QS_6_71_20]